MLVWSDNQIPKFSEGYGYTPDCLWEHIGSSGLPIRRNKPSLPEEIGRLQANVPGLGYFQRGHFADEIIINHSVPDMFVKSKLYTIGYTFWETNQLPEDWVIRCNEMDEVWTTTHAMKDIFINSGITKPVYEFKLGVDPKIYFPKKRTPHDQFTFLSVGSPATRKNSQLSVDAFLKVFNGNHNYRLIYKSNGPPDARIWTSGMIGPVQHPQIQVIDDEVSHEELGAIYDKADCLLFPTSGEGWGNIPFQGIAKGIPTICTNVLACSDFAHMSVPLDFTWGTKNMTGRYANAGQWGVPDFDDLCDKMLYVANNYEEVSDKTYQSAEYINKNMTWEKVSQKYIDRCWEVLKETGNL